MGHHKGMDSSQGNTMEQYTTPVAPHWWPAGLEVSGDAAGAPLSAGEPSRAELLAAIQGSRVALEGKIETVAVEINLLRADLRKVSDKVKVAEGSIAELQSEVGTLQSQVAQATSTVGRLEARLDDAEGRSRRNNVRLLGFPERAKGSAVAPGRPEGSGGATRRASGSGSPDRRSHGSGRLVESCHRVEIRREGTMVVVPVESDGGTDSERILEAGGDAEIT
ncbi:hypothetical protein NDU88_004515 [Pleurodeles waltl]|uniref:Uncharacterized protein n=1 Tax=Pleurodeles waltl TaxID=8319 RepID=A0AAV7W5G7_PLEWA|nr:hypothetical protein NDU88_004515 [Pleurodeles waltl]